MPGERLPIITSSQSKTKAKTAFSSQTPQRPHPVNRRRLNRQQLPSSSSSHPHPAPSSILVSDATMTPWGGLALSESSFTLIPPVLPPKPPPPHPPSLAPQPMSPTAHLRKPEQDEESSSFYSETPSPPLELPQSSSGQTDHRGLQTRRRVLPQRWAPRPTRLPPLRPITNLSFSRSFTFSFFELPLHQSPRCRAEHVKNLFLLLKKMHY